jgi:phosphorylcholine metabolism protein LicD
MRWCCFGGTLLGAVRDKDFAGKKCDLGFFHPFDFDIDVIHFETNRDKLLKVLNMFKDRGYNTRYLNGCPSVVDTGTEWADLWRFGKANGYYGVMGNSFHEKFFDKLKSSTIRGLEVPIPSYAEEFLCIYYGEDWMTPDSANTSGFPNDKRLQEILKNRREAGI